MQISDQHVSNCKKGGKNIFLYGSPCYQLSTHLDTCFHTGEKSRGEIGGVHLPSQLERIHHNFARDGRYCGVKGGGRAPPPSPDWTEFTITMEWTRESGHCQYICTLSSVLVSIPSGIYQILFFCFQLSIQQSYSAYTIAFFAFSISAFSSYTRIHTVPALSSYVRTITKFGEYMFYRMLLIFVSYAAGLSFSRQVHIYNYTCSLLCYCEPKTI